MTYPVVYDLRCWMCYICHTRLRQCHRLQQLAVQTRGLVDDICQNKVNIEFGVFESLIELSIFKTKNISTTHPSSYYIKQEPDIKTEPSNEDVIEDENVDNTYDHEEYEQCLIEYEDPLLVSGAQNSLNTNRNDTWQGSKVLELKIVKLSQSVIDKYVRQSPTTHTSTGEYHEGRAEQTAALCVDERSTDNAEIKHAIEEDLRDKGVERENTNGFKGRDHIGEAQSGCRQKPHRCHVCSKSFIYRSLLLRHVKIHTGEKPFICHICPMKFIQKCHLILHIRRHGGEKPLRLKKFTDISLKEHTGVRMSNDSYSCDVCSKKFSHRSGLKTHMQTHASVKPFSCSICQKKFAMKSYLNIHLQYHTAEKRFSCDICPRKFAVKADLNRHTRVHRGDKPHSCDFCVKKFSQKSNLTRHTTLHHPYGDRTLNCDSCSRKFSQESDLYTHKKVHTGDKPFSCDVCSKKFAKKVHLKNHELTHTGEKPFRCNICQKRFVQKSYLRIHMLIHSGSKPFGCHVCGKNFTQKTHLHYHMKSHAGEENIQVTNVQGTVDGPKAGYEL